MPDTLIARLESATGPDREIDTELELLVNPDFATSVLMHAGKYTGSLDATVGLVERLLPGWNRSVMERGRDAWEGVVSWNDAGRKDGGPHRVFSSAKPGQPHAATPTLALTLAALKALEAKDDVS